MITEYSEPVSPRVTRSTTSRRGIPTPEHIAAKSKAELLKFHKAQSYIMMGESASSRSKSRGR
jgi:hypothetical protein